MYRLRPGSFFLAVALLVASSVSIAQSMNGAAFRLSGGAAFVLAYRKTIRLPVRFSK